MEPPAYDDSVPTWARPPAWLFTSGAYEYVGYRCPEVGEDYFNFLVQEVWRAGSTSGLRGKRNRVIVRFLGPPRVHTCQGCGAPMAPSSTPSPAKEGGKVLRFPAHRWHPA